MSLKKEKLLIITIIYHLKISCKNSSFIFYRLEVKELLSISSDTLAFDIYQNHLFHLISIRN